VNSTARDPRSTAKRAEAYLKSTGIGDTVYVGPEAEFFMFDDVRFENGYNTSYYKLDDIELPTNSGTKYEAGNMGHRPRAKGGYFPVAPVDSAWTSVAKWFRPCSKWACPATSTTMKWQPHSMSLA
jgi:glutamine synthetase